MKLTKQLEAEIRQLYELYWNSYINGDLKTYASLLDTSFKFIGSTEAEPLLNKKDSLKFLAATFEQLKGKAEFRNRKIKIEIKNDLVIINELCDGYILIGTDWTFYSRFRLSSLLQKKGKKWKFIHQHVSMPDSKAQEGESYGLELIRTENMQLREAVKRRTVELESKNRELEIETALERVRTRSMAMHKSNDLHEVIKVVIEQLSLLGLKFNVANFAKIDPDGSWDLWLSTPEQNYPALIHVPYLDHPIFNRITEEVAKGNDFYTDVYTREETNIFFHHFFENTIAKNTPEERKQFVYSSKGLSRSVFLTKDLWFSVARYDATRFTNEENAILKRLANAFEQAYTRFLDLQKAEAQAKEAQVEAALERVRARSMAMQKSDELAEVVAVLYKQFEELGFGLYQVLVSIYDKKNNIIEWWSRGSADIELPQCNIIPIIDHPFSNDLFEKWRDGVEYYPHILEGEMKKSWEEYLFTKTDLRNFPKEVKDTMRGFDKVYLSDVFMKYGSLQAAGPAPLPDDKASILKKFVKVLDHAYTRMKDLQTAELQTREAQVELGLERVRSRAMAMQTSEELNELIGTVFTELTKLDLVLTRCVIWVFDPTTNEPRWWMANSEEPSNPMSFLINYHEHPAYLTFIKEWKNQNVKFVYDLKGQDKVSWDDILFNETELKHLPDVVKNGMRAPERVLLSTSFNNFGGINVASLEPLSEEHFDIMLRFAKVFDLTYTRFNDLKQAEAQAREAEIELALERVRAKTMAMQKPLEFVDVVNVIGQQFVHLGFDIEWANFGAQGLDVADGIDTWNFAVIPGGDPVASRLFIPRFDHPIFIEAIKQLDNYRITGNDFFVMSYGKKEKDRWLDHLFTTTIFKDVPEEYRAIQYAKPGYTTSNLALKDTFLSIGKFDTRTFTDEQHAILRRFGKAFGQAYTRFLDLQKAEAQARESQIQLALERVRARTMAMQRSDELPEAANLLFQQVQSLGAPSWTAGYCIWDEDKKAITLSMSRPWGDIQPSFRAPLDENPTFIRYLEGHYKGVELYIEEISGKALEENYQYLLTLPVVGEQLDSIIAEGHSLPRYEVDHCAYFSKGFLLFITYQQVPELHGVFKRFAAVFDQTYTRFLDLQTAEAQARESQIQLALERVRARTMAMQRSDELLGVVSTLYEQLNNLQFDSNACNIIIIDKESDNQRYWVSGFTQKLYPESYNVPYFKHPYIDDQLQAWKEGRNYVVIEYSGKMKHEFDKQFFSQTDFRNIPVEVQKVISALPSAKLSTAFFTYGALQIIGPNPLSEENAAILQRFAKVFDQTYTRFLDLQKAEAQTKESQIQLALERVRARTMAMQKSDELAETSYVLFQQFNELNEGADQISIGIFDEDDEVMKLYSTFHGSQWDQPARIEYNKHPVYRRMVDAWKDQKKSFVTDLAGELLHDFNKFKAKIPGYRVPEDELAKDRWVVYTAYFSNGVLSYASHEPRPKESIQLLERFASVFDGTYTRFLDLQKAEAQARESQIQLALERVRARTMAMQKSDELSETAAVLFKQFQDLGEDLMQMTIGVMNEDERVFDFNVTDWGGSGSQVDRSFKLSIDEPSLISKFYKAWKEQALSIVVDLTGKELEDWIRYRNETSGITVSSLDTLGRRVITAAVFSKGIIAYSSPIPRPEESRRLLERFAGVFDLTYTRFLDLKQAEAQAKEAKIEAALERVRSRTMAMHQTSELQEVIHTVHKELLNLNLSIDGGSFVVINEDVGPGLRCWGAGGTADTSEEVQVPHFDMPFCTNLIKGIKSGSGFFTEEFSQQEKKEYFTKLFEHKPWSDLSSEQKKETLSSLGGYTRSVAVSNHTSIFVINHHGKKFTEAENDILKKFAKVFEQTYTRFLDLQKAEAQAKEARIETALERIRARALAMHSSNELTDVTTVMREQMALLGQAELESTIVHLYEEDPDHILSWRAFRLTADTKGEIAHGYMRVPKNTNEFVQEWLEMFYGDLNEYTIELSGTKQDEWYKTLGKLAPDVVIAMEKDHSLHEKRYYQFSKFSGGALLMISRQQPSEESKYLLRRAAVVFDLAYRRFTDLQKAEAQGREAQIELALERVRARTMAMHKSEELAEAAQVLFHQLQELGGAPDRIAIGVVDEAAGVVNFWTTDQLGSHIQKSFKARLNERTVISKTYETWKEHKKSLVIDLQGNDLKEWIKFAREEMRIVVKDEQIKDRRVHQMAFFSHGWILVSTHEPQSPETIQILERFASVFNLTYRRFLDLQKAEAQAREAQIEAALERVRSRSLAMHKSDELQEVVNTVFERLTDLNVEMDSCNIAIFKEGTRDYDYWIASHFQKRAASFHMPYVDLSLTRDLVAAREKGADFSTTVYSFEEKNQWFDYAFKNTDFRFLTEERKQFILNAPAITVAIAFSKNTGVQVNRYSTKLLTEGEADILKRFSKVFEQAYIRFLDLEKAEAQGREAQIEAALERVRSSSLAMHKSEELKDVVKVVFENFRSLGLQNIDSVNINIFHEGSRDFDLWLAAPGQDYTTNFHLPYLDHPIANDFFNAVKKRESIHKGIYDYDLKNKYFEYMFEHSDNKHLPEERKKLILNGRGYSVAAGIAKHSSIFIHNYNGEAFSEEANGILVRFSKVFDQAYTRFLDLQKAEAQAREAQIEASLERVRAKAMAMHKSEDLHTAVATVFEELDRLKLGLIRCGIAILDKEEPRGDIWITIKSDKGSTVQVAGDEPLDIHPLLHGAYDAWLRQEDFSYVLKDEDMQDYYKAITKTNFQSTITSTFDIEKKDQQQFYFNAVFQDGSLFAFLDTAFTDEAKLVMKRFSNVFNLTYKRFLDLQKAEANAREAQIEAGLERVRARTMAMHSSEDVSTATATMFTELEKLGIENLRGGITIIKPDQIQEVWSITNLPDGRTIRAIGVFEMRLHPLWRALFKAKENKEDYHYYWLAGKDKEDYITILNATPNYLTQPIKEIPDVHVQSYFFGEGGVWTNSLQPHSEEDKQVMKRFASVFSLTFRRYQDLKKAEAQAREATIEAALEKVRGKAMAMHNSNDLSATTSMIIGELRKLGISPIRCGVGIIDRETHKGQLYTATTSADGDSLSVVGWVLLKGHPVLENIYEKFVQGEDYFPELTGDSMRAYYEQLLAGLSVPLPDFRDEQKHYGHFFAVSVGCLYTWSDVRYNDDELKILRRFASIIDLTFRRYFELQKSEANAREAVKQAALDRVRADIASMRSISDLDRITPLIWNELKTLSIPFIRCGVFIMDEDQQLIHTFLSTPDGKAIAAFHLPYDTPGNISKVIDNWRYKKIYVDHWGEEEFIQFADILMKQGSLTSREQYLKTIPRGGFYLHFLPFLQGMLYVGNTEQLNEEQIELIQHVADAFSTAYARYEDFNKLEAAKQQVENTLTDLKQAQTQLVQSEKMASLGELTAGIAHEIQNPLNFVNNFSEVSKELLDEMKEELATGNGQQAIEIAEDIIQNLEKINHHGKRADAIVKSMLQHSRSSSGKKEPTDINSLADEYLRLAYHGLRAKDKSFNAKFETGFDDSIGKVNIISQDIGRVLVNLINNAFYAVSERKKQASNGYEPTVEVFTKKTDDKIEITVKDNGNGIPKKVLDKIFQPFFTTKPTGQGTGLGLSLAYDIITKGHGGELKVETKEGEGSEFIIQLPAN